MRKRVLSIGICLFSIIIGTACKETAGHISIIDAYDDVCMLSESVYSLPVHKKHFSDDEILKFITVITEDTPELYHSYDMSRYEWQKIIIEARTGDSFPASVDSLQERVDKTANEESTYIPTSISNLNFESVDNVFFHYNGRIATCGLIRNGNLFTFFRDKDMMILGEDLCKDSILNATDNDSKDYHRWLMPGEPNIPKNEAFHIAQFYLMSLGIDLELFHEERCTVLNYGILKSSGWKFVFTRRIEGLQSQFQDGQWCTIDPNTLPLVGAPWNQEVCVITIDSKGLCQLWWQGASEIVPLEKSPTNILPFHVIRQNLGDLLWKVYTDANHAEQIMEVLITNVQLGIGMIAVDTVYEKGLYIPCWFVDFKYRWNQGYNSNWENEQIIFSAINGSYIEPRITDKEMKELSE